MEYKSWGIRVVVWRLILSLVVVLGIRYLPFKPSFAAFETLNQYGERWLTSWAGFDGVHYLTIADKGYVGTGLIQAFFPLYPTMISLCSLIINPVMAGIIISTLSLWLSLVVLNDLITKSGWGNKLYHKTGWLMLLWPAAFFATSVYNESMFLLLSLVCWWLALRKKWFWAGIAGALAAATRLVGVFLVIGLMIEYYQTTKSKRLIEYWFALLPALGLLGFMIYLQINFNDPLLFYHVQEAFGAGRDSGNLVWLPQVIFRYLKMLFTIKGDWVLFYRILVELMTALWGIIMAVLAFKRTRVSWATVSALSIILPTMTGNFSSMPRYVWPFFPLFMVTASLIKTKRWLWVGIVFGILQTVNLLLFTQGIFVA